MVRKALGVLLLAGTCAAPASAAVIYTQDFENTNTLPDGWSGAGGISPTEGLNPFGFGRQHLFNNTSDTTTLHVATGAAHTTATVSFDLAFWDSVDQGGDTFRVLLNGVASIDTSNFGNYFGEFSGPGVLLTDPHGAVSFAVPNYGKNPGYRDQGRRFTTTVAHTAQALTLTFQYPNSQGGTDEAFGIDNVKVEINSRTTPPVPEPTSLALLGLAGVFVARRRRA
jgi:hypothetical protein